MPKKKLSKSKLIKKLDRIFSIYVRLFNADKNGNCKCITCGKQQHYKQLHAGHFISRRHLCTRWDLNNVKPQCIYCNTYQQGRQYEFSLQLGKKLSQDLLKKSKEVCKFAPSDIQDMIDQYTTKVKNIT
tara:strand:+ start:1298 stop:1684 length:387 start_codon:yes stop_codon:yes gene_type:complete